MQAESEPGLDHAVVKKKSNSPALLYLKGDCIGGCRYVVLRKI